ncbi:MAG: CDP-alcohol phosphatidyltransferase family protein [Kiritimatiellae bacterium]|nr:CDP-alcohol phosphatidyltransferase family protein [Kiritimatiellia bacterium]
MSSRFHSRFVNALTFSRVPLIFAFMVCAVFGHRAACACTKTWLSVAACVLMGLAGITDLADGKLARRWGVVSAFGKLADPLMDKVFFIVSFPTLLWLIGAQGDNPAHAVIMLVFTVLYILRDQWVTFLRAVAAAYHADVSAMWLGKVRTALSFPAAGYIYFYLAFHHLLPEAWAAPVLWSVYAVELFLICLNVYSCAVYTKAYWPYMVRAMEAK